MKLNKRFDIYRVLRVVLGSCLAIGISMMMDLQNSISAGIITLLSIQNTKKETIDLAFQRFIAFGVAVIVSYGSFKIFGYNIWSFGLYLLMFISICYLFTLESVIAICSVLVTHFLIAENMHPLLIVNEFLILSIGVGIGIILNLFLSRKISVIIQVQKDIETIMREILGKMGEILEHNITTDVIAIDMKILEETLDTALSNAYDTMNNTLTSDMRYYVQYINLRRSQYTVLQRIWLNLANIACVPDQAHTLAVFFRNIAESFHEHNNAAELLSEWEQTKQTFRNNDLPKIREEFETRAILFQIFNDLQHFLLLKKDFSQTLTQEQKKEFWSH